MAVGACGISCDTCRLYIKGICPTCASGLEEQAREKLAHQMKVLKMGCPMLECAVARKIAYCPRDCDDFPCAKFESGFESALGSGPYPYSASYLDMFRRRLARARKQGGQDVPKPSR